VCNELAAAAALAVKAAEVKSFILLAGMAGSSSAVWISVGSQGDSAAQQKVAATASSAWLYSSQDSKRPLIH
jgi:hypothetical protein